MIGTAAEQGEPAFFDGRDYALMVTVDHGGRVQIQHQAEPDDVADRRMARLAAEIIDQIGPGPVLEQLGSDDVGARDLYPMAVVAPAPGLNVLACRCGMAMNLADMHRHEPPRSTPKPTSGGAAVVRPIVCPRCAAATGAEAS